VKAGIDVNARGFLGNTAISRASRQGHGEVLEFLLANGADPGIANDKLQFPLHFAAFKLKPEAVKVLLAHGVSPLVLDRKGRTPAEDTSDETIRARIQEAQRLYVKRALAGSPL